MLLPLSFNDIYRLEDAKSVTTKPAIERGVVYGLSDVPKDQVVETVEEEEEEEEEDSESVCILFKFMLMLLIPGK